MSRRVLFSLSAALACCMFTFTTRAQSLYSHWYLAHSITNPTPESGGKFGSAVSAVGTDKVLIGAYKDNTGASSAGSAYLYSTNGTLLTTYTNPTPESGDYFGAAVSGVGNDKVLIGASQDNTGATNAGAAYLYDLNGTLLNTYTNPTPESYDYFGYAVSGVGNGMVLIGAEGDNTGASSAGAAYLYGVVAPVLSIAHTPNPDIVRISWHPDTGSDLVLQVIPSLLSTNWIDAPSGTNNPALVPVAVAPAARFFRLNKP